MKKITTLFIILSVLLALTVLFIVLGSTAFKNDNNATPIDESTRKSIGTSKNTKDITEPTITIPPTTAPPTTNPTLEYKAVEVDNAEMHKGTLAYVSGLYKAVYPTNAELTKLYGKTEKAYMLSSPNIVVRAGMIPSLNEFIKAFNETTGKGDIVVWTGYRTEEAQEKIYEDYVGMHGEAAAVGSVAKPGESDHHTGYSVGLKVKTNAGYRPPHEVEGYEWLLENCYKYGFIERYPADKVNVTGMKYESSLCLRYVGAPHAEIMKQKDMCLEDYLTYIKDFRCDGTHFDFTSEDGTSYGLYFVPKTADAEKTSVNVPKESEYTIVGNNMDGFIVAYVK